MRSNQLEPFRDMNDLRFIVYGAGGIGGTIGARLFQRDESVELIARGAHLEAIRRDGLTLIAPDGEHRVRINAYEHPSEIAWRDGDVVLLCVKSQQTLAALDDLRAAAGDRIPVICVQNGVANESLALRRFARVYAMVVNMPTAHMSPGVVIVYAHEPAGVLDVGCYPAGIDALCERVADALNRAGFSVKPDAAVMRQKYAKLLMNLNNALQAATDMAEGAAEISRTLRDEALACYAAAGIDAATAQEIKARRADGLRYQDIPGHPRHGGSSWQSIARGTGNVETDYLNGEIVLLGRLHGVPTPANAVIQRIGNQLARAALPVGSIDVAQIRAMIDAEER